MSGNDEKKITLIGTGPGEASFMTKEAACAIERAQLLIGAKRIVESFVREGARTEEAITAKDILGIIKGACETAIAVLFSGDTGFYSGAKKLSILLSEEGLCYEVIPGISSIQMMAARLKEPWQDWKLASAHGMDIDPVSAMMEGKDTFFLTGGKIGPSEIFERLYRAGLGDLEVVVAERLSYDDEKITQGRACDLKDMSFDTLTAVLVRAEKGFVQRQCGIADSEFIRGDVPMTKQDVRSVILGRMHPAPEDIIWDVGAGTGSVSIELALAARAGKVYAIEKEEGAATLIEKNREKFRAWNLKVVEGKAPSALEELPAPDKVFIGGSGGKMEPTMDVIMKKNENAEICVSAILLETLEEAVRVMTDLGFETDVSQISVSASKKVAGKHMMMGENPIYIISGRRKCQG